MKYDLAAILRRQGNRRRALLLRPLIPPEALQVQLRRAAMAPLRLWARGLRESVLPAYTQSLERMTTDAATDPLQEALDALANLSSRVILTLSPELRGWAIRIQEWHKEAFAASAQAAASFDVRAFLSSEDAANIMEAYQQWAAGLIRGLNDTTRRTVQNIVMAGLNQQTPRRKIAKELQEALGISRKRALFIASDQTLKLSGQLDRMRQEEAGIDSYQWRHSGKLHPRPHHEAREGKVFRWDEPPSDGHPRTQPNCGCTAQAYVMLEDKD